MITEKCASHYDLGVALCRQFDLDPHTVTRLALIIDVHDGGLARLEVTTSRHVTTAQGDGVLALMKPYTLKETP